jgi:ABC-2 type transport system ATP-binding protein
MVEVTDLRKTFPRRGKRASAGDWSRFRPGRASRREDFVAVDTLSFSVGAGEIFGLLGPNGAGKTTTIRMLSTLLEPTAGTVRINGYDVTRRPDAVRQSLGAVLTGERSIYWKLTGRENLEYFAALHHLPPAIARRRIGELLDRLELANRADEYVERYSSGMKQRIAIAKALLADPPVVLLDEPTVGLDPQAARNLRELILDIKREGRTVLLTTHYMEEADQLSDRIGIIDQGKIIALDTPATLKNAIDRRDVVHLEVEQFDPALIAALAALPSVECIQSPVVGANGTQALALHTTDSRSALPRLIETVSDHNGRVRHLQIAQPTLEDVFISLTGKQLRE